MKNLPNLLIVDDAEINLFLLESILEPIEINLIQALSGAEALEKTKGIELALAIIDVRMPGMDGYELAVRINENRIEDKVPVIFLTAINNDEYEIFKGYDSGAVDYLFKPIRNQILLGKVNVFLNLFNHKQTIKREALVLEQTRDELLRVNASLNASEAKYRSYIENAPDGVFVVDEKGRFLEVNDAACKMTGYFREELLSMSVTDLLLEEFREEGVGHLHLLVETGFMRIDLPYLDKSGKKQWFAVEAVKVSETKYLGFANDIIHRIELEETLRSHKVELELQNLELEKQNENIHQAKKLAEEISAKYTTLYDFAPTGYFTLSLEKKILELNHSGAIMLGIDRPQAIGCSFDQFVENECRSVFVVFLQEVFESKSKKTCEVVLETIDRQLLNVHIEGVVDEHGDQLLLNIIDITIRKKIEAELNQTSTRLALATRASGVGVWDFDIQKNSFIWDDQMFLLYGLEKQDLPYNYEFWMSWIHPDDKERIDREIQLTILDKNEFETEFMVCRPDGSVHDMSVMAMILRDHSGIPLKMVGTNRDITDRKKIENVLKKSESNLAEAQRISKIGSWEWDMEANSIKLSREMFRILDLEYSEFDLNPESLIQIIHPEDREMFMNSLVGNMFSGESPLLEYRILHKDGSIRNLFAQGKMELNDSGLPVRGIGTVQDITESKRLGQELTNNLNALNETGKIAKVGGWQIDVTTGIQKWTDEVFNMFEIEVTDEIPAIHDMLKFCVPASRLNFEQALKSDIQSNDQWDFESEIITAKGNRRWVHLIGKATRENDVSRALSGVIQDVTERKQAELILQISEEKYKTILNSSPDGILLIDMKGVITEVSEIGIELFGADSRDDLLGKDFYQFVPVDEKGVLRSIIEKTLTEGLAQNLELKFCKKNQSIFAGEISSTLIQDHEGIPFSFMFVVRDISHRKKMETKQMHADRMANLGEMAAGIAHEINQPLNIISMVMDKILFETAKEDIIDVEFLTNKSNKIFENIIRIRNIIDHIRAFSRSHDNFVLTAFDINLSIQNAVSLISEQFKHLGIAMKLQLDENIPQIVGNTYQFEQVIINLLTNAKDAVLEMKSHQEEQFDMCVVIHSYQENEFLIVEVVDNGIGINKEEIHNILLPFYTTKEEGKGTGLGLSICYQIIREMGGNIEISSENLQGSKIRIVLKIENRKEVWK
ncbi:MAG: PAS domain S-box protein [Prolixibacteraceae bacterium]